MGGDDAVEEFGSILNSMLLLKPPGVSGSKIKAVTELCVENVQSESVLIQKLYTHFKRAPGSHKLGVLYVVDSIVRAYIDEARKSGQDTSNSGPDGTFTAGIHRVTDILTNLMNDIMQHAPEDTKEKIKKLLDIWARGSTFPSDLLAAVREKHFSNKPSVSSGADVKVYGSTTPEGSPPAASQALLQSQPQQQNSSNTAAILQALAQMAKQNNPSSSGSSDIPTRSSQGLPPFPSATISGSNQAPAPQNIPLPNSPPPYGNHAQPAQSAAQSNLQNLFPGLLGSNSFNASQPTQGAPLQPMVTAALPQGVQALFPAMPQQQGVAGVVDPAMLQQLAVLQVLSQSLPAAQLSSVMEQLGIAKPNLPPSSLNQQPIWQQQSQQQPLQPDSHSGIYAQHSDSRYDGDHDRVRGPFSPGRDKFRRGRSRSRSPPYRYDEGPVRRRSPTYGDYEGNSGAGGRDRDRDFSRRGGRGRGGGGPGNRANYRRERSPSPMRERQGWGDGFQRPPGAKLIDWDESLKPDRIRVLSRTLFVGGVSTSEEELRALFQSHGDVQSCIVNYEKRHAFIKMKTRVDAVKAKDAMETHKQSHFTLRTRWGVGFGPRDCSDYQTGISDIPIDRLTDADRRWMLSAEYGGTGGRPMEPGMVIEEPDIEIGQGVSSKAISRRMQTDQAGAKGPKSTFHNRGGGDRDSRDRGDRDKDRDRDRYNSSRGSRQYDSGGGGAGSAGGFGLNLSGNMGAPFYYQDQQHANGQ